MFLTLVDCAVVTELIGQKWVYHIVVILHHSPRRYNKISQILPQISPTILSGLLKKLCITGLVWRDGHLYVLTPFGEELANHVITFVKAVAELSKKSSSGDHNLLLSR